MNRAEALAMLREVQEANESASKALGEARVISGRQAGKVAEQEWINTIKEEKTPVYAGDFFVVNTDRPIN